MNTFNTFQKPTKKRVLVGNNFQYLSWLCCLFKRILRFTVQNKRLPIPSIHICIIALADLIIINSLLICFRNYVTSVSEASMLASSARHFCITNLIFSFHHLLHIVVWFKSMNLCRNTNEELIDFINKQQQNQLLINELNLKSSILSL